MSSAGAVWAKATHDYLVRGDRVIEAIGGSMNCGFDPLVLEWRHPAATVTDEMMVMFATGQSRLEPGHPVTDVEPLDQSHALEQLERPVNRGDADGAPLGVQRLGQLGGGRNAALAADQVEHRRTGTARAMALGAQPGLGHLDPLTGVVTPIRHHRGPQAGGSNGSAQVWGESNQGGSWGPPGPMRRQPPRSPAR